MPLSASEIRDLQQQIADRLYIQISGWHLYLGDAGLAEALAIECAARLDQGAGVCARQALEAVQAPIGGGSSRLIGKVVDAEAQVEKALMQEMETAFRDFGIEARIYSVDGPAMVGRSHLELPIQVREERVVER